MNLLLLDLLFTLKQRVAAALVIVTIVLLGVIWSKWLFYILMTTTWLLMLREWFEMTRFNWPFLCIGIFLISICCVSLLVLRSLAAELLPLYFSVIWAVDLFAMLGGKIIGGPKLAVKISPGKTWSGLIVGILAAGGIAALLVRLGLTSYYPWYGRPLIFGMLLSTVAQLSDLFISLFKRKFGLKDFSKFIPGHGGVMDRCDSLVLTAPIMLGWVLNNLRYFE